MSDDTLSSAFLQHLVARGDFHGSALTKMLERMLEESRLAWPALSIRPESYFACLARRVPKGAEPLATLELLHASDLYLVCGCELGDSSAIAAFEAAFFADAEVVVRRTSPDAAFAQEILQRLRVKLFVAEGDALPRISLYAGRGDLRSWFRVVATREAVSALRSTNREESRDDAIFDVVAGKNADPELSYLFERHAAEFRRAFVDAARALMSEERNLLRYHYVDSLSIDHIGAIYRIHRVTASRRLNNARDKLIASTRALLAERLSLSDRELASVLRLIESRVDISIRRALGDPTASGGGD